MTVPFYASYTDIYSKGLYERNHRHNKEICVQLSVVLAHILQQHLLVCVEKAFQNS